MRCRILIAYAPELGVRQQVIAGQRRCHLD
jgi:hypothetical protein